MFFQLLISLLLCCFVMESSAMAQPTSKSASVSLFGDTRGLRFPTKIVNSSSTAVSTNNNNTINRFVSVLQDKVEDIRGSVILRGVRDLFPSLYNGGRLAILKLQHGIDAVTYTEHKQIQTAKRDAADLFNKVFLWNVANSYFTMRYIYSPLFFGRDPWFWAKNFPSTFDNAESRARRQAMQEQWRHQSLVTTLLDLQETSQCAPNKAQRERASDILEIAADTLEKCTKSTSFSSSSSPSSLAEAYKSVESSLTTQTTAAAAAVGRRSFGGFRIKHIVSPRAVTTFLKSIGAHPLPTWGIFNVLNRNAVAGYFRTLKNDDQFIMGKGIANLTAEEISMACSERGISPEISSVGRMRKDLTDWINIASEDETATSTGNVMSPLERRATMFALNIAREFPVRQLNDIFRHLSH